MTNFSRVFFFFSFFLLYSDEALSIRCTLATEGGSQRNVRTAGKGGDGGGTGEDERERERRYRFPGGGWWGIDDRIASTPAEPITRLNLRSPLSFSLCHLSPLIVSLFFSKHTVSSSVVRAFDSTLFIFFFLLSFSRSLSYLLLFPFLRHRFGVVSSWKSDVLARVHQQRRDRVSWQINRNEIQWN